MCNQRATIAAKRKVKTERYASKQAGHATVCMRAHMRKQKLTKVREGVQGKRSIGSDPWIGFPKGQRAKSKRQRRRKCAKKEGEEEEEDVKEGKRENTERDPGVRTRTKETSREAKAAPRELTPHTPQYCQYTNILPTTSTAQPSAMHKIISAEHTSSLSSEASESKSEPGRHSIEELGLCISADGGGEGGGRRCASTWPAPAPSGGEKVPYASTFSKAPAALTCGGTWCAGPAMLVKDVEWWRTVTGNGANDTPRQAFRA